MNKKICNVCKKLKDFIDFYKCKKSKDGLQYTCKYCCSSMHKKYHQENSKRINKYNSDYLKYTIKVKPWKITLKAMKQRCNNKNAENYPYYGGRGINCLITVDELKELWFRDKASLMKKPSIDRIDNDGHYAFDNCRYIEMSQNITKRNKHHAKTK